MEEKKQIKITLKSFSIIALIIAFILLVVIIGLYLYHNRDTIGMHDDFGYKIDIAKEDDMAVISYEGTFKSKGVVVRVETDILTIMPIVANTEYTNNEKFYYEDDIKANLKQGQEVIVTYHYRESSKSENNYHEPVIDNIEIIKEKSNIEIPNDILVKAYSSKDKIDVFIDKEKSNNKQIEFVMTDSNELKYDYFTMKFDIRKYNSPPTKTEITYTEQGASIAGYDPWPELTKIKDISTETNYSLNENGQAKINLDWSEIYGELGEGEYKLTFTTVSNPRTSIINPDIMDYPYDSVNIYIKFKIDTNNNIEYEDVEIY